jgi:protocatechuate 3,4-dioxygenase beta subunit
MQLLIQTTAPDYAAWKTAFDAEGETMADAGLTMMQIWTADAGGIFVLFEATSRPRAEAWLKNRSALGHAVTAHFLQTA